MRLSWRSFLILLVSSVPGLAQNWDTSGNSMLNGTYYMREVTYIVAFDNGDLSRARSVSGTITFDGVGNYTITAQSFDSAVGVIQNYTVTQTYAISASGFGFLNRPDAQGGAVLGLVSNGIFIGSSTESPNIAVNSMFVAAKAAATPATVANVTGTYWVSHMTYPSGAVAFARDAQYSLVADGAGNIATMTAKGFIGNSGEITQTVTAPRYTMNGSGTLTIGGTLTASTGLIAGTPLLYVSEDGNFIFGGSATGWDMFAGVRLQPNEPAPSQVGGTYYQAGIDQDLTTLGSGFSTTYSYYGALTHFGSGLHLAHQRVYEFFSSTAYDYTYQDTFAVNSDNTFDDGILYRYKTGANGTIRIGQGRLGYLGVNVALKAPNFSGSGVYINPTGLVNAASSMPFTIGVSKGMFATIYGTGLASTTVASGLFPTTLAGVTVLVNSKAAPIYFVSPGQISFLIPYSTPSDVATVQVINGIGVSNAVSAFVNQTTPGFFTLPPGGVGYAAALHPDYSVITPTSPARPGETVALFMTGLGSVSPTITEGMPGPVNPLSLATAPLVVSIGGRQATIVYQGLAPQLSGMYQLNFTIPAGTPAGDLAVNISGPDSYNSQALLPIGAPSDPVSDAAQTIAPLTEQQIGRRWTR